jgi:hypothetical protein
MLPLSMPKPVAHPTGGGATDADDGGVWGVEGVVSTTAGIVARAVGSGVAMPPAGAQPAASVIRTMKMRGRM